jgi:hypothetical protein
LYTSPDRVSVAVTDALGTTASVESVTVPVSVPVKICAGAKLTAISTIKLRKKAESRRVKSLLLLVFVQWTIVILPKRMPKMRLTAWYLDRLQEDGSGFKRGEQQVYKNIANL